MTAADPFSGIDLLLDAQPMPPSSGLVRAVILPPEAIQEAARRLFEAGYHLEDIGGLDCAEGLLVTYHFDQYDRFARIAVRVPAGHENAHVPSIAAVFNGAEWHERELSDLFGVTFDGNPNPVSLLLPANDRSAPLRKKPQARRPLRELMDPGPIVHQVPDFDWFPAEDGTASSTPDKPVGGSGGNGSGDSQ